MRTRTIAAAMLVVAVAMSLVAACGGDTATTTSASLPSSSTGEMIATTSTLGSTSTAAPTTTAIPATTTRPVTGTDIMVTVTGDTVDGDDRYEVPVGEEVTITIEADVDEEVHVHGYDLTADVAPDSPAVITFVAGIPGIFEVELEASGRALFELVVE